MLLEPETTNETSKNSVSQFSKFSLRMLQAIEPIPKVRPSLLHHPVIEPGGCDMGDGEQGTQHAATAQRMSSTVPPSLHQVMGE